MGNLQALFDEAKEMRDLLNGHFANLMDTVVVTEQSLDILARKIEAVGGP
jgi:hypothetical protein